MAGGTWSAQNKTRPGVYIRFRNQSGRGLNVGDRGTVAICEPMSWGPVGEIMTVEAGADTVPVCGYDITNPKARFLNEIFKGSNRTPAPKTALVYRPAATDAKQATATAEPMTATALYPGVRGNDITVVVTEAVDAENTFTVSTVVDGAVVDEQTAAQVADLVPNGWVTFSGTGVLAATVGAPLTGGADGTVQSAAYSSFLMAVEPYKFDILIYDGSDATVQTAMMAFVKRLAEENGQYAQLVTANMANPDTQYVVNVVSGVTLSDRTQLTASQCTWWVGGAEAGARYNESLTYASYPGAVTAVPTLTNNDIIAALTAGKLVLTAENGQVRVEQDINSLITYTAEVGKTFHKNRVMRLCNTIANDIYTQFATGFIGVVDNNGNGRALFKTAIVGYLLTIQGNQGIQSFSAEDVEVLPGDDIDAIVVNIAITPVDSVEKIYLTVSIS